MERKFESCKDISHHICCFYLGFMFLFFCGEVWKNVRLQLWKYSDFFTPMFWVDFMHFTELSINVGACLGWIPVWTACFWINWRSVCRDAGTAIQVKKCGVHSDDKERQKEILLSAGVAANLADISFSLSFRVFSETWALLWNIKTSEIYRPLHILHAGASPRARRS